MPGIILSVAVAIGLTAALPLVAQSPAAAVSSTFEVASVRLTPPGSIGFTSVSPFGGARFTATNVTLRVLVGIAFGWDDNQISDTRDLLGGGHYDVDAKPEGGGSLSYERLKPLLRSLLAERFKLATHHETKESQGYALVIGKGGPKLRASNGATGQYAIYPGGLQGPQLALGALASMLASPLGRPVVDKTGIEGTYDIHLEYAPDANPDSSLPSIFTALQEQLGLRLEPQKVPLDMLVIDHCERVPTEN